MEEMNIPMEEQEIPSFIFPRLIEWMRMHEHSDEEIVDCILHICRTDEDEEK